MTSFSGNAFREVGWNPTFKVQGQVYHRIGSLLPETATGSAFLQIYFIADYNQQADAPHGHYSRERYRPGQSSSQEYHHESPTNIKMWSTLNFSASDTHKLHSIFPFHVRKLRSLHFHIHTYCKCYSTCMLIYWLQ